MNRPNEPIDFSNLSPSDLSHGLLVAVLMAHDGSITIPADVFQVDALGGFDGQWHAVAMEPLGDDKIRLSVRPRPDVEGPGVRVE